MKFGLTFILFAIISAQVKALKCEGEDCLSPYSKFGLEPIMVTNKGMEKKMAFWDQEARDGKIGAKASAFAANCVGGSAGGYPCSGVNMLSFVSLSNLGCGNAQANDIWGWTDPTGNEYVLAGCTRGTSFVDVTDARNPIVLGFLRTQTSSSPWRDIKVYNGHAYIGAEAKDHGIQVFDLSQLTAASDRYRRAAVTEASNTKSHVNVNTVFTPTAVYNQVGSSHNVVINEDSGFLYVLGGKKGNLYTCRGGLHMVDINDPANPQFAGCFSEDGYTHDAQCVIYSGPDSRYTGNEICFAYNEDTITIVDVTVKSAPVMLSKVTYLGVRYSHQGWLNAEQSHLLMDDELDEEATGSNTESRIFDVSLLDAPRMTGSFVSTSKSIDHNQYIHNGYSYQANYCAGLRILDASTLQRPSSVKEVAYFQIGKTCSKAEFSGAWSNYPFFASGTIALNSIEDGLFLLKTTVLASRAPTAAPSGPSARPTKVPSLAPISTAAPTSSPAFPTSFPAYTATNTATATRNTVNKDVFVCPGTTLTFSLCRADGGSCNGDTYLRLFDASGSQVAQNDDACGGQCASIRKRFTASCQTYSLRQGCYGSGSCGGTVSIACEGNCEVSPVAAPVAAPVTAPSPVATPTTAPDCPGPFPGFNGCDSLIVRLLDTKDSAWFVQRGLDGSRCSLQEWSATRDVPKCPAVPTTAPDCPGPFPGFDTCESLIVRILDTKDSAWYVQRRLDGSRCSLQELLSAWAVPKCPAVPGAAIVQIENAENDKGNE